jgi:hypothetical protein
MPALVAGIHIFLQSQIKDVMADTWLHMAGHDAKWIHLIQSRAPGTRVVGPPPQNIFLSFRGNLLPT